MPRFLSNLLILVSLGVLGLVGYYYVGAYRATEHRAATLHHLHQLATSDGACTAFDAATKLGTHLDYDMQHAVDGLRQAMAAKIVGDNRKAQAAFLDASRQGLISPMLCEQIKLVTDSGDVHPVVALLLFTRENADPCQHSVALDEVLRGLGEQRSLLLHELMKDVERLHCLPPAQDHAVAHQVARLVHEDPQAFDDLDVLRIASFLTHWVPLEAAEVGCMIDARGDISRLGSAIGCSRDQLDHVLTRYRYTQGLPAKGDTPAQPPGSEVVGVWQDGDRCQVRTRQSPPAVYTVSCDNLQVLSGVSVAVRVDPLAFGVVKADLIAGLASYDGTTKRIERSGKEPPRHSWFAYAADGRPLGTTQVVSLDSLAKQLGAEVPDDPLRAFCHASGAKYCYDVDWAQVVAKSRGAAVVFLSRPINVFLHAAPSETAPVDFAAAFGRPPNKDDTWHVWILSGGGLFASESSHDSVQMRWRLGGSQGWHQQVVGAGEGGSPPPMARLIAALDMQGDGRPEIIVQRVTRRSDGGQIRDHLDEIYLMRLAADDGHFEDVNRLTVHEY